MPPKLKGAVAAAGFLTVKMLSSYACASGVCRPGKTIKLPIAEAEELIKEGFAVQVAAVPEVKEEDDDDKSEDE